MNALGQRSRGAIDWTTPPIDRRRVRLDLPGGENSADVAMESVATFVVGIVDTMGGADGTSDERGVRTASLLPVGFFRSLGKPIFWDRM
jgi:hypothetical protein